MFWKNTIAEVSLSRNGFLQSVELKEIGIFGGVRAESKVGESANPTRISCTALLLCAGPQYQSCERDVFAAINDSGLVFDGGLVVDLVSSIIISNCVLEIVMFNFYLFEGFPYSRSIYIWS